MIKNWSCSRLDCKPSQSFTIQFVRKVETHLFDCKEKKGRTRNSILSIYNRNLLLKVTNQAETLAMISDARRHRKIIYWSLNRYE